MTYSTIDSPQGKIEGKFYPLQTEENVRANRELTKAQMVVYYHLKTLDPFGDKLMDISITDTAAQLGLTRFTVSRALKVLDYLGWLDLELVSVRTRVQMKARKRHDNDQNSTYGDQNSTYGDQNLTYGDQNSTSKEPETLPCKGFKPSKTNKTIHTLQTLSTNENEKPETEREIGKKDQEKFRKFAKSKMEQLPKYPVLPKRWIAMHFEELWAEYEELEGRREENEERIRESIEKPQDTGLDPIIAAGLASGKILKLDSLFKGLWDAENIWHHQSEWIEAEKRRLAED